MITYITHPNLFLLIFIVGAFFPQLLNAQDDFAKIREELLSVARKKAACKVDKNGLPRRVIITRNGAGLFARPGDGKAIRKLSVFERLYLFVENEDGRHRVGPDPFTPTGSGWVSKEYCLMWDHNQMIFLDERSVPDDATQIHMWATMDAAKRGDLEKAIYSERIHRDEKIGDIMFPVVDRDDLRQVYKVAFVFGGDEGGRDDKGQRLTERERRQVVEALTTVNIVLVMDATGSMGPWIEEAKEKATAIVDALELETIIKDLKTGKQIGLTVNFGVFGYRDEGDEFVVKEFVPLTTNRKAIKAGIASLEANGGGDYPESVVPALRTTLKDSKFERGALNRIILIGDAPPRETKEELLNSVGAEASSQYVQIDALVCGGSETVKKPFTSIAKASSGSVRPIKDASFLSKQITGDIRRRLSGAPVEVGVARKVVDEGKSFREAAREYGLGEYTARQLQKLLIARGADVGKSGIEFDAAWIRVVPGSKQRVRVLSYMANWELANHLSTMLGATEELTAGKDEVKNAEALVLAIVGGSVGDKSSAGLEISGKTARERVDRAPVITLGVKRGKKGATMDVAKNKAKIRGLMDLWRKRDSQFWEGDYVWVPVDLLP